MEKRQRSDWDEGGGDPLAVFTCLRGDPLTVFTPPVATPEAIWTHTREEFHS